MKRRLFLPELVLAGLRPEADAKPEAGTRIMLTPDRTHYLNRVLRLRVGDELALFDGRGWEYHARLIESRPRQCEVELLEHSEFEEAPIPLVLAQSWLKGHALDTVVQKAVELGSTGIWLVDAERSNVKLDSRRLANKMAHLKRVVISAAEQCGTLWLPEIRQFESIKAVLKAGQAHTCMMLDLDQPVLEPGSQPQSLMLLVGPEGGWSDAERSLALEEAAVALVGLGSLTLRAETAPLAALAAIRHSWGWLRL